MFLKLKENNLSYKELLKLTLYVIKTNFFNLSIVFAIFSITNVIIDILFRIMRLQTASKIDFSTYNYKSQLIPTLQYATDYYLIKTVISFIKWITIIYLVMSVIYILRQSLIEEPKDLKKLFRFIASKTSRIINYFLLMLIEFISICFFILSLLVFLAFITFLTKRSLIILVIPILWISFVFFMSKQIYTIFEIGFYDKVKLKAILFSKEFKIFFKRNYLLITFVITLGILNKIIFDAEFYLLFVYGFTENIFIENINTEIFLSILSSMFLFVMVIFLGLFYLNRSIPPEKNRLLSKKNSNNNIKFHSDYENTEAIDNLPKRGEN